MNGGGQDRTRTQWAYAAFVVAVLLLLASLAAGPVGAGLLFLAALALMNLAMLLLGISRLMRRYGERD